MNVERLLAEIQHSGSLQSRKFPSAGEFPSGEFRTYLCIFTRAGKFGFAHFTRYFNPHLPIAAEFPVQPNARIIIRDTFSISGVHRTR